MSTEVRHGGLGSLDDLIFKNKYFPVLVLVLIRVFSDL